MMPRVKSGPICAANGPSIAGDKRPPQHELGLWQFNIRTLFGLMFAFGIAVSLLKSVQTSCEREMDEFLARSVIAERIPD